MPASYGELPDDASQIVATFDGPFTAGGGRGVGERESAPDIFADPFLDGPAQPRLGLLMLRDAQIAQTDFAATYLAIGLGLDPAVSPHVAELRDRTSR